MDRRNALFALCIVVLFGCDDYGVCKKQGCSHDDGEKRSSWGSNDQKAGGSVVYEGATFVALTFISNGIDVRDTSNAGVEPEPEPEPEEKHDAGVDASAADADADVDASDVDASDADAGVDAFDASVTAHDAGAYPSTPSYPPPGYYDTSKRMEIRFVPPAQVGVHRLEDTSAFAIVCRRGRGLEYGSASCIDGDGNRSTPSKIRLVGTLEVLDVRTDEMTADAPKERPYELPWGWHMQSTNEDLRIDVRVESKPTWHDYTSYCN